jgi:hypothetical protein
VSQAFRKSVVGSALVAGIASASSLPAAASVVTDVTLDADNVINDVSIDGITIASGDFVNPGVSDFDDGNEPQLLDNAAAGGSPTFAPNASFIDGDVDTGFANIGSLVLDFSASPLVNDGNTVLVLVDIGFVNAVESFSLTTDAGGSFSFDGSTTDGDFLAATEAFDLFSTGGDTTSVSTLAGLNAAAFDNKVLDDTTSGRTFVAVNLDDLGLAPNAVVTSVTIDTGSANGSGFDLTEGFAVVVPEPASLTLLAAGGLLMASRRRSAD